MCGHLRLRRRKGNHVHATVDDLLVEGGTVCGRVALDAPLDYVGAVGVRGQLRHVAVQRLQHEPDLRRQLANLRVTPCRESYGNDQLDAACALRVEARRHQAVLHALQLRVSAAPRSHDGIPQCVVASLEQSLEEERAHGVRHQLAQLQLHLAQQAAQRGGRCGVHQLLKHAAARVVRRQLEHTALHGLHGLRGWECGLHRRS